MSKNGKDTKLYVSTSGTATSPLAELQLQGDMTINTGKSNNRTGFKNGAVTAQGNDGWSASTTFAPVEPMGAAETALWAAHDNATPIYMEAKGPSGSMRWKGVVKVAITEVGTPVSGARLATLELSEDGTITRDTVA